MESCNITAKYKHKEKGGIYVIKYINKMKYPDTGEWIRCVTYKSLIDDSIYTCSLKDFTDNFENCEHNR